MATQSKQQHIHKKQKILRCWASVPDSTTSVAARCNRPEEVVCSECGGHYCKEHAGWHYCKSLYYMGMPQASLGHGTWCQAWPKDAPPLPKRDSKGNLPVFDVKARRSNCSFDMNGRKGLNQPCPRCHHSYCREHMAEHVCPQLYREASQDEPLPTFPPTKDAVIAKELRQASNKTKKPLQVFYVVHLRNGSVRHFVDELAAQRCQRHNGAFKITRATHVWLCAEKSGAVWHVCYHATERNARSWSAQRMLCTGRETCRYIQPLVAGEARGSRKKEWHRGWAELTPS